MKKNQNNGVEQEIKTKNNKEKNNLNKKPLIPIILSSIFILISAILVIKIKFTPNSEKNQTITDKKEIKEEKIGFKIREEIDLKKHNQELVEKLNKVNKKINEFLSLTNYYNKYIDDENIKHQVDMIRNKYYTFLNIKRFAIPIIGSVSVGKSTLLNYLLDLKNFLETGTDITTRFLCIIRHNINYKKPLISNITIEDRGNFKYNFEIDKYKIDIMFDNDYIKQYNKFFSKKENRELKIEEKYFLLIEVDIPFFHGDFEKYADLIEFIDIPGLNEVDSNNLKKNNIYFSQIIPFIQPNYLFSIFLFEDNNFQSKDAKEILMDFTDVNYLDCVDITEKIKDEKYIRNLTLKKIFKESLFILNKKDKNENTNNLKDFKDNLWNIFIEKDINNIILNENKNLLELNLKFLNLELNKFNSFEDYLNYTLFSMNSGIVKSLIDNLNKDFELHLEFYDIIKMEEEFNLTLEKINYKREINKIINRDNLKYSQIKKLKEIFKNNVLKITRNNEINILTKMVRCKIKSLIDDYLDIKNLSDIKRNYIYYLRNKGINDIEDNYFKLLKIKQKKISLKNPKEFINNFDNYMKELIMLNGKNNNQAIESLNNKFSEIKNYSAKQYLSSLLLIGEYSSGKSSFVNSLIGLNVDLLPVKSTECSQIAIIVRYTEKMDNITLYSAKLEKSEKFGINFREDEKIAEGLINVKNKISLLNENKIFNYYILYTPIKAFEDLNFDLELKKKIELIDFPGLASSESNDEIEKKINKLLGKKNAFIFLKKGKEFNVEQSSRTINFIYKIIKAKNYFNINNCLFIFTFPREYNYDMDELKKSLIDIFDKQTIDECMIKRKKDKNYINENKLIISKFDSPLYEDYLEFKKLSDNFTLFTEKLISICNDTIQKNRFYECLDYTLKSGNYNIFSENYSILKVNNTKEIEIYIKLLKKILKTRSIKVNKNHIASYIDNYLKIKENKNLYLSFSNSNYEEVLQQFKKIIYNIEIMLNETLNYQIHEFSIQIFNLFNNIQNIVLKKDLAITKEEIKYVKKKIEKTLDNIDNIFQYERKKVNEEFDRTKIKINKISIENFEYNKSKEDFLNSERKVINKYENRIKNLDIQLDDHFENYRINSKKELDELNNEEKFKSYFINNSVEFIHIIHLIEENKNQAGENLHNEKYKEYNYYDTDEYKNSSLLKKPYSYVKGKFDNYYHDYKEDMKNHSRKIIKEIKAHFRNKRKNTLKNIREINDKINSRLFTYKEFLNSEWDNIIKNKKKYIDLSKKIINYLENELYKN